MNMDYEPMWRVVDVHRRCADELERILRELTGDRPVDDSSHVYHQSAPERDDLESYDFVMNTLIEVRDQLWGMADRVGHNVRRQDALRCNIFARRCDKAVSRLTRKGEL